MAKRFNALTTSQTVSEEPITINNRVVETLGHTEDVLWCEFRELCMKPRSPSDFIEKIANIIYNTFW